MSVPLIKIVLADDHQIFIEGLKVVLQRSEEIFCEIIGESTSGGQLLKIMPGLPADLLLLDMNLPDMDGLEVLTHLKELGCKQRVIILSMYDEPKIVKAAFKAGVDGYILKSGNVNELFKAIDTVMKGETFMSFGLSFTDGTRAHTRFSQDGKISVSYEDRFIKKFSLTKRELEVLKLIGQALSNKDIAKELYISDQTASVHRKNIMRKLGVSSTASLIKLAFEHNLL
jgi:DNA-binding NarL/FixJ family response regulator